VQIIKEDGWVEYVSCKKWLHQFCFTYTHTHTHTHTYTQLQQLQQKITARGKQDVEENLEHFIHCSLDACIRLVQILCTYDIFFVLMLTLIHYFDKV